MTNFCQLLYTPAKSVSSMENNVPIKTDICYLWYIKNNTKYVDYQQQMQQRKRFWLHQLTADLSVQDTKTGQLIAEFLAGYWSWWTEMTVELCSLIENQLAADTMQTYT